MDARLESKLSRIRAGQYQARDFIVADAKDGDMAFGVTAPGPVPDSQIQAQLQNDSARRDSASAMHYYSRTHYLQAMADMAESELIDILLMSASSAERLQADGLFERTAVVPAVRMNDTTDIWSARGSRYRTYPSQPFATADLEAVTPLCNLGLYSMTFSNDVEADRRSLEAYGEFRRAARRFGFRHFLEIFNPAFDIGVSAADMGHYINDMIIKAVAGVTESDAPLFLKIQFNGTQAMQELTAYDPVGLIAGILGGASGTTRDTFELLSQAEAAGARVALFGRKINLAEAPLELVRLMRQVLETDLSPKQAVQQYHEYLNTHQITSQRTLDEDLCVSDPVLMDRADA